MTECPQCGHQQDGGRFCSACGSSLESSATTPTTPAGDPLTDPLTDPLSDPLPDPETDAAPAPEAEADPEAEPEQEEKEPEEDPDRTRVRGIPPVPPLPGPTGPPPSGPPPSGPPPSSPPPAPPLPEPGARYPLFADEAAEAAEVDGPPDAEYAAGPLSFTAAAPAAEEEPSPAGRRRTGVTTWLVIGAICLLVLLLGLWLLFSGGDGDDPAAEQAAVSTPSSTPDSPTTSASESPSAPDSPQESGSPLGGAARDVAGSADAGAPSTAPSGTDVTGNTITYAAGNMVDGDPQSAWRMAGDGTGTALTFDLDSATTLTEVGLINGYDKTSRQGGRTLDWYTGNRRVQAVEWEFDDGHTVRQTLRNDRAMQTVQVPEYTTETVTLRLVTVSAPGQGPAGRDYTAVSEVSLTGKTG